MSGVKKSNSNISRRKFVKYGLCGGLTASLGSGLWLGGCRKASSRKRPNLILISIDTLRADHLGCYGYSRPTSPIIDKFASEGLLFEDVSSTSPWTLPSHASVLTGLYPHHTGVRTRRNSLPDSVVTLADVFTKHNFITAAAVNSYWLNRNNRLNQGFHDFAYVREDVKQIAPSNIENMALKWLSKHRGKPFFLFLHYYDIHSDYRFLPRYEKQFVRPYSGIANGSTAQLLRCRAGKLSLNQLDARHLIDLYDASIRQMDDGLGRLFKFLETKQLFDDTFVVIISDHGEEFLEHSSFLHGRTYFQEIIKVPLLLRGPDIPKSKRIKHIVSLVDVMPTLLSLFDIPEPTSLDGFNLCPLWQNTNAKTPLRFIFAEADWNNVIQNKVVDNIKCAVRNQQYKLHYNHVTRKKELYDLRNDPQEKIDLALEHGPVADLLFRQLKNFANVTNIEQPAPPLSTEEINKLKSLGYL